jgi:hypothetical protein
MNLFSPEDIELKYHKDVGDELQDCSCSVRVDMAEIRIGKVREKIAAVIGDIAGVDLIDYTSMGRWSMHHLLFYLLEKTGPAKVWFTTWAISTKAITLMVDALKDGTITELHSLLDRRIRIRRSDSMAFLTHNANSVFMIDCHAKVLLIENDAWRIVVKSSANFSENKRIESGVIMQIPEVYAMNKKWIEETIKGEKPFEI